MLTVEALADYTQGRLDPDTEETSAILARSLAEVRRFCRWHVTPVITGDVVTMDGPGGQLLRLPTLRVSALTAVTEDGVALDLTTDLEWSADGMVRKLLKPWTDKFRGVTVTMTHGYDDADDFEAVVFSVADRKSQAPVGGVITSIGPFRWSEDKITAGSSFTATERAVLEMYRLDKRP